MCLKTAGEKSFDLASLLSIPTIAANTLCGIAWIVSMLNIFDAPVCAVDADAYAFVAATDLGEMIYPGSPGSKDNCRLQGMWSRVGVFVCDGIRIYGY